MLAPFTKKFETSGTFKDRSPNLQAFLFALFFSFGGITSLNDVLIPKLKSLFTLSYAEVMLVQSAFFAAYFVVSIPAAMLVKRLGYMQAATAGLLVMTAGCLLFVPASTSGQFSVFLVALFVLAAGITTVQVVANPLVPLLGNPATASSRLTYAQAFNALGTTVFPYVGSALILGRLATVDQARLSGAALNAFRSSETRIIVYTYLALATALSALALLVWLRRGSVIGVPSDKLPVEPKSSLLSRPQFLFGAVCIFLYVGAEVSIGSLIVSYLMHGSVLGLTAEDAGKHVPFYWGGAMIGRFLGAYVLRILDPGKVLAVGAAMVALLLLISANTTGELCAWTLLSIGLFNSIMFPTIFSLSIDGLGPRTATGSGVICMAIVGGAIVPLLSGRAADVWGLKAALVVPAACYLGIVAFGWFSSRQEATHQFGK